MKKETCLTRYAVKFKIKLHNLSLSLEIWHRLRPLNSSFFDLNVTRSSATGRLCTIVSLFLREILLGHLREWDCTESGGRKEPVGPPVNASLNVALAKQRAFNGTVKHSDIANYKSSRGIVYRRRAARRYATTP